LIALKHGDIQIWHDNYCIVDSVYNVFSLEKTAISHPVETSSIPSTINKEQLHMSPTDRTGAKQLPHITAALPTVAQEHRPRELVSVPPTNTAEPQLSKNSPEHPKLQQYPQQLSNSHTSPTYAPQQSMFSPQNDVGRTSQALRATSPQQIIPGRVNRPHEPVSLPLASNNPECQLEQNSPQHRHLQQYPQQSSDSHARPTYIYPPQQRTSSPQNGVGRTSQAVRGRPASPKQMIPHVDVPSHSRPTIHATAVRPFVSPVEQQVYDRQALNQQYTPAYHYQQYSQPAGNYDRYRHRDATSGSHGLYPYRQHVPLGYHVGQPKIDLPTSDVDVDGMRPQKTTNRTSSYREQPPAANYDVHRNKPTGQADRSSTQRDVFAVRNGQSQSGERTLSFGDGLSPHRQNVQRNDPYRLHYPAVDRSSQVHHDRVGSEVHLSKENDVSNRLRIYGGESANNNITARVAAVPAVHGVSPAVGRSPQYSAPAYYGQENSELFRYPSPSRVVEHSASPRPMPPAEHQPNDLRNLLIESPYFRGRQVCTPTVCYIVLYLRKNDVVTEDWMM